MDGIHDIGGMDGFEGVDTEDDAQFHERWEQYVFAMGISTVLRGLYNIDQFRHGVERTEPSYYLSVGYYERWLDAMERLLVENGVVSVREFENQIAEFGDAVEYEQGIPEREDPEFAALVSTVLETGASKRRDSQPPEFAVGQEVRVRNIHPSGHTRLPQYVRRATGTIDSVHGTFVVPDTHAVDDIPSEPEPVYCVKFTSRELWGPDYSTDDFTYVDLWERYLTEPEAGDDQ